MRQFTAQNIKLISQQTISFNIRQILKNLQRELTTTWLLLAMQIILAPTA